MTDALLADGASDVDRGWLAEGIHAVRVGPDLVLCCSRSRQMRCAQEEGQEMHGLHCATDTLL